MSAQFDFSTYSYADLRRELDYDWAPRTEGWASFEEADIWKRQKLLREEINKREQEAIEAQRLRKLHAIKDALNYSESLAHEICARVSAGELLINMSEQQDHLPTVRRAFEWMENNSDFKQVYNQAIQKRLSIFEDQIIQIADDSGRDWKNVKKRGGMVRIPDPEQIARSKLRVDSRRAYLKAMKPQIWGDSTTVISKNADDLNTADMSDVELEQRIADIDAKQAAARGDEPRTSARSLF